MLPLYDENPRRSFPIFTISLIALNITGFVMQLQAPGGMSAAISQYAMVPADFLSNPFSQYPTLITSMFMHGGPAHLAGNMLYLWIFGDNIEDRLGRFGFVLFYFLCGVLAAISHMVADPSSSIPAVGASGAISGILGAYLVLFPGVRVRTLIFLGFYISMVRIPAIILLGIWILMQVANSVSVGAEGEVAWLAHIGGFAAGAILIKPFQGMLRRRA
ncbi:MAG: rhomboid family intramembrane serine protease [Candidatus Nitronauta litoralis]|uniref:Rhomboid family intramembrane serine protease n=1 Tax=Candidatus Nitronauta litoralis TaxID=2705533 RepID=A0A7T0BXM7_9BACT|nr:MAG: rhomboid family intramembrane serine protease [Candidatus Nitronauta litoralis]